VRSIHVGLALFPTEGQRHAALPLLAAGEVDALEWTFDVGWSGDGSPAWVTGLLDEYGAAGRLYGHGVNLSPTSARWSDASAAWLARLAPDVRARSYRHVTEHWGCSRAGAFVSGAPLPVVACAQAVGSAIRALAALADVARVPVGLENLALAFSQDDVDAQPVMLGQVLDATGGILLLDLHNVWCQAVNFERDVHALVAQYPLGRVRQLHVAGGRWSGTAAHGQRPFRRDTHDALVPPEVMELVRWVVPCCPALEAVILERLPHTLDDAAAQAALRTEWRELAAVVRAAAAEPLVAVASPSSGAALDERPSEAELARYQDALVTVLAASPSAVAAHAALGAHPDAAPFAAQVRAFEPRALEVAMELVHRWGVRTAQ